MDEETNFLVQFGCGTTAGGRQYQEDRLVATRLNGSATHSFFAVFDGHGGERCSELLSRNFHKDLINHPKFGILPIVALQETWASFDDKCLNAFKRIESADPSNILPGDGSTATVCLITGNDLYLTNCGDSAAYVIHQDGTTECLTEDHGTNNPDEIDRCLKNGGSLKPQFYFIPYPFPCCMVYKTEEAKPRMLPGGLLVTRSFGDFNSKLRYLGGKQDVIISGHGKVSYINAKKTLPKYVILASDGVWDVLSIAEVSVMIDEFFKRRAKLDTIHSTSSIDVPIPASPAASSSSRKGSPKNDSNKSNGSPKVSANKVIPLARPAESITDLNDTAGHVESELINARYTELNPELNELATWIVNAAAKSPKWEALGCSADNTSMIIVSFTPKTAPAVPETVMEE